MKIEINKKLRVITVVAVFLISACGKDFLDFLKAKARSFGRPLGVEYAEGFIAGRIPGVNNLFDLV